MKTKKLQSIEKEFDSIRKSIEEENVSYFEIAWLQLNAEYIHEDDTLLLQWAGVEGTN